MAVWRFPKHPMAITTVFRHCVLANFAVEPDALARVLPAPLRPAIAHDRAWLSVVIAEMERLRPAVAPRALGFTYHQVVYRAVVELDGWRGVHFLRSDADDRLMCLLGNAMSFFEFHHGPVAMAATDHRLAVVAQAASGPPVAVTATYDLAAARRELPPASRFADLPEAKHHLVDLFDAFHPGPHGRPVDVVTIERNDWQVQVVPTTGRYTYLDEHGPFPAGTTTLDSVFVVEDLHYLWHRLRKVPGGPARLGG